MHDEVYSDGVSEITVTGPIVRIDLMSLSPTERDANNNPKPLFRQRIIMPIDTFANAVDLMQKAVQELIGAGAIQQGGKAPPSAEPQRDSSLVALSRPARNSSPNFS